MPTTTVEDYLKKLYMAEQARPGEMVPMGAVASDNEVTPGTATSMIKALAESGLVEYTPRVGTKLTRAGRRLALQVLRRHRLIELFLVEIVGLDWSEVHAEAEVLEHAISDKLLARIDELLGFPETDPHGDPIPTADGKTRRLKLTPLLQCEPGQRATIARITDQSPAFLQFIERHGLTPGSPVVLITNDPDADAMTLKPKNAEPVTIGTHAATKIWIAHLNEEEA